MSEPFDPYHTWLGIPPDEQPPDYYRLLGLKRFESNRDVISHAADQRMAHIRSMQNGQHVRQSQKLLNELSKAATCLLNPRRQAMYDQHLRSSQVATEHEQALTPPAADEFDIEIVPARKIGRSNLRSIQARRLRLAIMCIAVGGLVMGGLLIAGIYFAFDGQNSVVTGPSNQPLSTADTASPKTAESNQAVVANVVEPTSSASSPPSEAKPVESPPASSPVPTQASLSDASPTAVLETNSNPLPPTASTAPNASGPSTTSSIPPTPVVTNTVVNSATPPTKSATAAANAARTRSIPDEQALETAKQQFERIFKEDLARAKTPREQLALADRIMALAAESQDDQASRYVMLEAAHKLALESGDLEKTLSIINDFGRYFDVKGEELKAAAVDKAVAAAKTPAERKRMAETAIAVTDELIKAGRFDLASTMIQSAVGLASRAKEVELGKTARELRDEITLAKRFLNEAQEARAQLASNPDDRALNLRLGRFVCFHQHDWEQGLPYLARGADETLAGVAELDRANPVDPEKQLALGQAWWDAIRAVEAGEKRAVLVRSLEWMRKAEPQMKGLAKASVDKRIKEIEGDLPPRYRLANSKSSKSSAAPAFQPPREFTGMLGRIQNGGTDIGVLWKYESGLRLTHQNISDVLAQANVRRSNFRMEFVGLLYAPESTTVNVGHGGGSPTGTLQLFVDNKPVGEIGGARATADVYKLDLNAGEHTLRWVLSGENLGNCSLTFANAVNAQPLTAYHTAPLLQLVRESPTRARLNVNMTRQP